MTLNSFEWIVVAGAFGLGIAIIAYFLKRTMNRTDTHDTDIHEIKRTYVTKDELKEFKSELRDETRKLAEDVTEIKEHYIRKDDFLRITSEIKDEVRQIRNLLIQERGGKGNGQK